MGNKLNAESTEKYIAFLQEAYEKNPLQNAWCLEEANQLKKQLDEERGFCTKDQLTLKEDAIFWAKYKDRIPFDPLIGQDI